MFVKKSISNGRTFLVFAQGYRKNGKVKHKTIERLDIWMNYKKNMMTQLLTLGKLQCKNQAMKLQNLPLKI